MKKLSDFYTANIFFEVHCPQKFIMMKPVFIPYIESFGEKRLANMIYKIKTRKVLINWLLRMICFLILAPVTAYFQILLALKFPSEMTTFFTGINIVQVWIVTGLLLSEAFPTDIDFMDYKHKGKIY